MRSFKSGIPFVRAFFLFLFFAASALPVFSSENKRQSAFVEAALSGSSVRLQGGKELRYAGIETYSPDSKVPLSRTYGENAHKFNQSLVAGKKIQIEWGPKLRDKQNRLLGYVFTEDGLFVNGEMVKQGHAKVRILVPNVNYADELKDIERDARAARRGLWEKEPPDSRAMRRYIGEKNTKIYYFPDSPELEKIPEANLVEFNSRVDAKAAGYRACFSCRQKGELDESE